MEHHGAALHRLTRDDQLVQTVKQNFRMATLSDKQLKMLHYVEKLTLHPHQVAEEDIAQLRAAGFEDREILDICQITSYFNFVNRMADGLGVQLEAEYLTK